MKKKDIGIKKAIIYLLISMLLIVLFVVFGPSFLSTILAIIGFSLFGIAMAVIITAIQEQINSPRKKKATYKNKTNNNSVSNRSVTKSDSATIKTVPETENDEKSELKTEKTVNSDATKNTQKSEARIREDESKPAIYKEAQQILISRKEEFSSNTTSINQKYTGNIDSDIFTFYGRYIELLDNYLKSKNINCNDLIFINKECDVLNISDEQTQSINCFYKFNCRGMDFAFIENGNGLCHIGPVNELYSSWYEKLKDVIKTKTWFHDSYDILAALSANNEIYVLFQSGLVKSSDPEFEEVNLFSKIDEARRICSVLPIYAVLQAVQEMGDIEYKGYYYSWIHKCYIASYTDGSYDTGVYQVYASTSKEYMLGNYLVDINLIDMLNEVNEGTVPLFAMMDCLPEDPNAHYRDSTLIY